MARLLQALQLSVKPYRRELDDRRAARWRRGTRLLSRSPVVGRLMMLGHTVVLLTLIAAIVTNACETHPSSCGAFGLGQTALGALAVYMVLAGAAASSASAASSVISRFLPKSRRDARPRSSPAMLAVGALGRRAADGASGGGTAAEAPMCERPLLTLELGIGRDAARAAPHPRAGQQVARLPLAHLGHRPGTHRPCLDTDRSCNPSPRPSRTRRRTSSGFCRSSCRAAASFSTSTTYRRPSAV